jgi:hypothetical protein
MKNVCSIQFDSSNWWNIAVTGMEFDVEVDRKCAYKLCMKFCKSPITNIVIMWTFGVVSDEFNIVSLYKQ